MDSGLFNVDALKGLKKAIMLYLVSNDGFCFYHFPFYFDEIFLEKGMVKVDDQVVVGIVSSFDKFFDSELFQLIENERFENKYQELDYYFKSHEIEFFNELLTINEKEDYLRSSIEELIIKKAGRGLLDHVKTKHWDEHEIKNRETAIKYQQRVLSLLEEKLESIKAKKYGKVSLNARKDDLEIRKIAGRDVNIIYFFKGFKASDLELLYSAFHKLGETLISHVETEYSQEIRDFNGDKSWTKNLEDRIRWEANYLKAYENSAYLKAIIARTMNNLDVYEEEIKNDDELTLELNKTVDKIRKLEGLLNKIEILYEGTIRDVIRIEETNKAVRAEIVGMSSQEEVKESILDYNKICTKYDTRSKEHLEFLKIPIIKDREVLKKQEDY
ncbi:hypothetical protein GF352_00780 [archaeon]|nr:hypothetical protein [archaeon]